MLRLIIRGLSEYSPLVDTKSNQKYMLLVELSKRLIYPNLICNQIPVLLVLQAYV